MLDFGLIDSDTITASQIMHIEAIETREDFSMPARDNDIKKFDVIPFTTPKRNTPVSFEWKNSQETAYPLGKHFPLK